MKILQLISGNLGQGGGERLVIDLSEAQASLGHNITICSFRHPSNWALNILPAGMKYHSFGKHKGLTVLLPFQIARYIRQNQFDMVNCHLTAVFPYIILSILVCTHTKFFYTIHSNPFEEERRGWMRAIRSYFIRKGRLTFVGISKIVGERFDELYKTSSPIPVVYNGRKQQSLSVQSQQVQNEIAGYKLNSQTKVFIAVGRLMPPKNYQLMMNAFSQLVNKNIMLIVLGNDYDGWVEQHKAAIPENVHFLGGKANVFDYLSCADCFIMSSIYEGLPISILEAYSAGLPVVSTPVGGIPDIVTDGVNGFLSGESRLTLVNEGENGLSVEEFVAAIQRYLDADEATIQKMHETNRQLFADRFDIHQTAQQYLELYKSIMNG